MFKCRIENTKKDILTLTQNESNFQVLSVQGLNPPSAQINTSKNAGSDGASFNSSSLNVRNIVITIKLRGNIEKNRIKLYSFFRSKEWCKFYYSNNSRNVYIEGYVENVECDLFTNKEIMQISILCPNPYFKNAEMIIDDISKTLAEFEFPFAIDESGVEISSINNSKITNIINKSESESGLIIEIDIFNSINKIQLNDIITGDLFILNYEFVENDKVIIDTNKGNKSIKLIRNGKNINLFAAMSNNSTFFQLNIGDNFFSYLVDDGANDDDVHILFKHYTLYGGV